MMLSIIHELRIDVREDGNDSKQDDNDTSEEDIITELILHVAANSKTEPQSFVEISRAIRAQVQFLKARLPTEYDGSESGIY